MVCAPVRSLSEGIIDRTDAQTMLYLTCMTIPSVDLAHYGMLSNKISPISKSFPPILKI